MKLNIIQIGNSLGIRLPKAIIKQCHFESFVEAEVKDGVLIIMPHNKSRYGWEASFKEMGKSGDDELIDSEVFELETDKKDWSW